MAIAPEEVPIEAAPDVDFPEFHYGDVLRKARHEPLGRPPIKSAAAMAALLESELRKKVAGSTVTAWERARNQPSQGVTAFDVVRAYARITGWPVAVLQARIEACRSSWFVSSGLLSGLPVYEGQGILFDPDGPVCESAELVLVGAN